MSKVGSKRKSENNEIFVSVCCLTYNHEKFVRDAVNGFLMQKTNFPFEIIIHDDASTDRTSEILKKYEAEYPNIIKGVYQKENQYSKGARGMFVRFVFPHAKGKYIAICEGDDYWTDPLKLQKQVDFLEANPDYAVCWTKATYLDVNADKKYIPESFDQLLTSGSHYTINLNSYFDKYATPTLTTVFRKEKIAGVRLDRFSFFNDTVLFFHLLSKGKGALLNFNSATYRVHNNGVWSGANNFNKKLNLFYALDSALTSVPQLKSYDHLLVWRKWNLTQAYYLLAESFKLKDFKQFSSLLIKILKYQDKVEKRKALRKYFKTLALFR